MCGIQVNLFSMIADVDRREAWRDDGARDMAHWLWMRFGISAWKAARWIAAARALPELPRISDAFAQGELGIDKVVELTRFATPDSEDALTRWALTVSSGAIRRRGDRESRTTLEEVIEVEETRTLSWWYFDEGRRFGLEAELPAAQGAAVAKALERVADSLPCMPEDKDFASATARRADALVALCSARIASDADQDRATIVVHAKLDDDALGSAEIEGGPPVQRRTLERLACNARVQTVVENASGDPVGVGRLTRVPPDWMARQIRHRDQECRFPGCGARRFTQAHHIDFWRNGGRTDPQNLVLICSFHHRLVHEYGWRIARTHDGDFHWFRSGGTRYRAGPGRARTA